MPSWCAPEPPRRVAFGMSPEIRPGALVLVRFDRRSPCPHHMQMSLPLFQNVGVVDRIDAHYGEHCVVVRFPTIACPPFGSPWVDAFSPGEVVLVDGTASEP
jgi:hypothetical protein